MVKCEDRESPFQKTASLNSPWEDMASFVLKTLSTRYILLVSIFCSFKYSRCVCMCVRVCVRVCVRTCACVCVGTCTHVCVCVCVSKCESECVQHSPLCVPTYIAIIFSSHSSLHRSPLQRGQQLPLAVQTQPC